jgi:hypothetical protein
MDWYRASLKTGKIKIWLLYLIIYKVIFIRGCNQSTQVDRLGQSIG